MNKANHLRAIHPPCSRSIEARQHCSATSSATPSVPSLSIPRGKQPRFFPWPRPSTTTAPSTECQFWAMLWKRRAARIRRFSVIAVDQGRMFAAAGSSTSSFQKTAEAIAYHWAESPPTIGVAALLRLAHWCEQCRRIQGGTTSCPTPRHPPVDNSGLDAAAAPATLAAAPGAAATSGRSTAQRIDSAPTPSARRQGGGQ